MRKSILISILCFLSIFLVSCATFKEFATRLGKPIESLINRKQENAEQKEEWEYGRLVFMGDECVAWFSRDLNLIGPSDMKEYFQKNKLEPVETKILSHFTSQGWEVVEKNQKDKYTTEYQLKREKTKVISATN